MPSHSEGLAIARVRIAEEKEKRTGFLDLGRLGLTELPEELFELECLWGLNLGSWWWDGQGEWHEAEFGPGSESARSPTHPPSAFSRAEAPVGLTNRHQRSKPAGGLEHAAIARLLLYPGERSGPAGGLEHVQSLNCSNTQVSDLGPLAGLSAAAIAQLL